MNGNSGLSIGFSGNIGSLPHSNRQGGIGFSRFGASNHRLVQHRIREIKGSAAVQEDDRGNNDSSHSQLLSDEVSQLTTNPLIPILGLHRSSSNNENTKLTNAMKLEAGPQRDFAVLEALKAEENNGDEQEVTLENILNEHELLIKYVKGADTDIISETKKYLRSMKLKHKVAFRTDRNLKWSPQYFLDDKLTTLRGYLPAELLTASLCDQLDEWAISEEDPSDGEESEEDPSDGEDIVEEDPSDSEIVVEEDTLILIEDVVEDVVEEDTPVDVETPSTES